MCQSPPSMHPPPPTAASGHQGAPSAPETPPSPLPAPQHSSDSSQHMPGFPGTWHSHVPHPEPTYHGQRIHQLPAAGLGLGLFPAKHWLHASDHMGFLWGRFGSLFFCLFSGCQNTPSAQERAQLKLGLPRGHHCATGMAVPKVCALAHGPPRAFLGLTQRLEAGQAGRGGEQDTLCAPSDTRAAARPRHRHIPPVQPRGNRTHQTRRARS